jgi:hypothetical protein
VWQVNTSPQKIYGRTMVTSSIAPHLWIEYLQDNCGRLVMTSAHAHPGLATKVLYFSLGATVFIFVSMLLLTGLHP